MITLHKPHNITDTFFLNLINEFNKIVRFSYNRRIKDNIDKQSDLEKKVKESMKNIENMDASWIKCAVKKSLDLQTEKKLYFGGKTQFFKRKYKKIDKLNKNFPMEMRGSCSDSGNRKAEINGDSIIFKPMKGIKYQIKLDFSKNEMKMLNEIQCLSKNKKSYFNISLSEKEIFISFNEPVLHKHEFKRDRYLGIDLNPNWIALSILDNGTKEIYKELIDLRELNKQDKNKKQYELSDLNKRIINLCNHYMVEKVCLENLNIKSSNKGKGRKFNKLLNNDWNRNYIVNNLCKWLNINDIKYFMVNPFYTSFMGQIKNMDDYDSIAASKEVSFRGYLISQGIKEQDYVNGFLGGLVSTHWKEMIPNAFTYKDLYNHFKTEKKSKNSYRFLFNDAEKQRWSYFRLKSIKSMIDLISF